MTFFYDTSMTDRSAETGFIIVDLFLRFGIWKVLRVQLLLRMDGRSKTEPKVVKIEHLNHIL